MHVTYQVYQEFQVDLHGGIVVCLVVFEHGHYLLQSPETIPVILSVLLGDDGLEAGVHMRDMPAGGVAVLGSPADIVHPVRPVDNGLAVKDGLHGSPGFSGEMPFGNGGYGVMTCPAPSETVGKGQ